MPPLSPISKASLARPKSKAKAVRFDKGPSRNQRDHLLEVHNERVSRIPSTPLTRTPGSKLSLHEREPDDRKSAERTRDLTTCKARPEKSEPARKTAGAGGKIKRRFIPWC